MENVKKGPSMCNVCQAINNNHLNDYTVTLHLVVREIHPASECPTTTQGIILPVKSIVYFYSDFLQNVFYSSPIGMNKKNSPLPHTIKSDACVGLIHRQGRNN
ncbi:hypothetical protein O6H91_11G008700 [Diphasiastrum complanatum]|uniref:Uncharacterized protein n=1 Tax=Diphasiastrum complanatum TaxID=34168 RepID=A0ACC2C634_DIPCM|nr:hypothetical protein O6H91_11G008700 [Diphasiastrum complanatum]